MKQIIYIRTSTTEQNPQNQLKDCLTLTDGEYEVVEEKQSAYKDTHRALFENIRTRIIKGEVKRLICWDLDRLYRNRLKLKGFMELCKANGCKILSYRQKFLNEIQEVNLPQGFDFLRDMMLNNLIEFLGWIAEDESKKKSDRVKIAYQNRKGNWGRRKLPKRVEEDILELHRQGMDIRSIAEDVTYYDKNRNKKNVSVGFVHKTIKKSYSKT